MSEDFFRLPVSAIYQQGPNHPQNNRYFPPSHLTFIVKTVFINSLFVKENYIKKDYYFSRRYTLRKKFQKKNEIKGSTEMQPVCVCLVFIYTIDDEFACLFHRLHVEKT